jgi:hypothetical protein
MATPVTINTDYLKFDAFSIKNLINKKLSEDSTFTDYVYDGSNLSIFIDIFANMFQVLMYNLNHTASESMFTDTQIYENINRLVKFIGYNPRGYSTSNTQVNISYAADQAAQGLIVPPYSYIKLNKTDKLGNYIYYSTVDYYYLYNTTDTNNNIVTMYNGEWIKYNTVFTAEGIPYEKFILSDLVSDSTAITKSYLSYPHIHVYVKRYNSILNNYVVIRFNPTTDGLFVNNDSAVINNENMPIFNLRLNEYKQYEIQFGDGIHGQGLLKGDIVTIVYMNSNGPDGIISLGDISSSNSLVVGITNIPSDPVADNTVLTMTDIMNCLFTAAGNTIFTEGTTNITDLANINVSTTPTAEETVTDIQTNAPQWFKSVGRLITQKDIDYFIRTNFYNDIVDIKVMNNWEYITSFYKWLYIRGLMSPISPSATKYINSSLEANNTYRYADAADSNNVYVWLQPKAESTALINSIDNAVRPLKPLTSEVVFVTPITKEFFPCVYNNGYSITNWDANAENYIEIEIDKNILVSYESLKTSIASYIENYFNALNQKIGNIIDLNTLNSYILSIAGIKRVRTVFVDPDNKTNIIYITGLSFACWTPDIIDGEDVEIINSSLAIEPFQFASLATNTILTNHIKIIAESTFQTNQIEY